MKDEKINFLFYKNKISTNNHKLSSINNPVFQTNKKLKRSRSTLENKIIFPITKTLLLDANNNKKEAINRNLLEYHKIKTKTILKNESMNYFKHNISNEKESDSNNKINKKFYYNLICLGHDTKSEEINKVNSPSVKYFLYNISRRNKIQKNNISPLYNNYNYFKNSRKLNNLKSMQPNYSLIEKKLEKKYNNLNKEYKLPNIISHKFSPIVIKNKNEKQTNTDEDSEDNSSFENNQFKTLIEDNILKKEAIKNELKKIDNLNLSVTPFQGRNTLKIQKNEFLRIKNKVNYKIDYSDASKNNNRYKEANKNKSFALKKLYKYLK